MQKNYLIIGYKPAHSKAANDLLIAFDLGISGAFIPFADNSTVTFRDDATPEQIANAPEAIRKAYERCGCTDVKVVLAEGV